jgi:hypothetical protein
MAETKYGKYIITNSRPPNAPPMPPPEPGTKPTGQIVLFVDDNVLKGAFYLNCALVWGESDEDRAHKSHTHEFDEYIGFQGSNPEDPSDLGGEVEIWLGDEKHMLTKSCAVFVPKGLPHCPIIFRKVDRPIFYFSTAPNAVYESDEKR